MEKYDSSKDFEKKHKDSLYNNIWKAISEKYFVLTNKKPEIKISMVQHPLFNGVKENYRMTIMDLSIPAIPVDKTQKPEWHNWPIIGENKMGYSTDKCMNCGSHNLSEKHDEGGSWAFTYLCNDCGSKHLLNIPDTMGCYGAVPEISYQKL